MVRDRAIVTGSNPVLTTIVYSNKITPHMKKLNKEEMELRQAEADIRKSIIKSLEDLKAKIESDDDLPEGPQDIEFLVDVDDKVDEILNAWYY